MSVALESELSDESMHPMEDLSSPREGSSSPEPQYDVRKYRWITMLFTANIILWLLGFAETYVLTAVPAHAPVILKVLTYFAFSIYWSPVLHVAVCSAAIALVPKWGYAQVKDFRVWKRSCIASTIFCVVGLLIIFILAVAAAYVKDIGSIFFLLFLTPIVSFILFIPCATTLYFTRKILIATNSDPKSLILTSSAIFAAIAVLFAIISFVMLHTIGSA